MPQQLQLLLLLLVATAGAWRIQEAAAAAAGAPRHAHKQAPHHCGRGPFPRSPSAASSPPAALADPVFQDPWVQANVAVSFDPLTTKDGVGSQVHRLFAAYAVAACSHLRYVHTAGFQRFTHLNASDARHAARRLNTMLGLPQSPVAGVGNDTKVVAFGRDCAVGWDDLAAHTRTALAARQATLFSVSFTYGFALAHPAMLDCVPALRQQVPVCAEGVLRPVRIAVHIRAGDAENDGNRLLPHAYYFSIIRALAKELRRLQRDYVVEVYTQAAYGIQHHSNGSHGRISGEAYVQRLHANIGRHMLLLADMDVVWSLGQMASADVLVHSKSTLSIAAGILNTKGLNVAPPAGSLPWPWLQAPHWHHPSNATGEFEAPAWQRVVDELAARFGPQCQHGLPASPLLAGPDEPAAPAAAATAGIPEVVAAAATAAAAGVAAASGAAAPDA